MALPRNSSSYRADHPLIVAWERWRLTVDRDIDWISAWDGFLAGWEASQIATMRGLIKRHLEKEGLDKSPK